MDPDTGFEIIVEFGNVVLYELNNLFWLSGLLGFPGAVDGSSACVNFTVWLNYGNGLEDLLFVCFGNLLLSRTIIPLSLEI